MEPVERIFGNWMKNLAPGIPNPSKIIRAKILYRSAREKPRPGAGGFPGDNMEVDLDSLDMPLEEFCKIGDER